MKASVLLVIGLMAPGAFAQSYRINYQPKVGSVAKHEVRVYVTGKASEEADAEDLKASVVLHCTQKFTRVTPKAVEGDLTVKLIGMNQPNDTATPPDFKAWKKGVTAKFSYAPSNPLGFLEDVSPPAPKSDMNATGFTPTPPMPATRMSAGDYWDITKTMFTSVNPGAMPGSAVDVASIGQAVLQFLYVQDGVGRFESYATLPVELITGLLDMKMDLRMASNFGIHMATGALRNLETHSQVTISMGGPAPEEGQAPPKSMEMKINLRMVVRALD